MTTESFIQSLTYEIHVSSDGGASWSRYSPGYRNFWPAVDKIRKLRSSRSTNLYRLVERRETVTVIDVPQTDPERLNARSACTEANRKVSSPACGWSLECRFHSAGPSLHI